MSIKNFFSDTKSEIKKVIWPTKQVIVHSTLVVLVIVVVMTVAVSFLDVSFGNMFDILNTRF